MWVDCLEFTHFFCIFASLRVNKMDKNDFRTYYLLPHFEAKLIKPSSPKSFGQEYIKSNKHKRKKQK